MTVNIDKLHGTVAVQQADLSLTTYAKINVDKLHGTVAVQQADLSLTTYAKINVDKFYVTIAVRGPTPADGLATGTTTVRALSELVQALRPAADTSVGSWTKQDGTTSSLYLSVAKYSGIDDTTYITAAPSVANDAVKFKLEVPTFEVGDEGYVDYRIAKSPSNASQKVNITVNFYQGASVIASWTHTDVSGTLTDITQTLTAPQVAAITDYTNLYLEIISQPQ